MYVEVQHYLAFGILVFAMAARGANRTKCSAVYKVGGFAERKSRSSCAFLA